MSKPISGTVINSIMGINWGDLPTSCPQEDFKFHMMPFLSKFIHEYKVPGIPIMKPTNLVEQWKIDIAEKYNLKPNHIELVVEQTNCDFETSANALAKYNGDIVEAIMMLSMIDEKNVSVNPETNDSGVEDDSWTIVI